MKLVSFSLQNYRSIVKAEKIKLGELTILIGPNNEGKSNILRGLVTGMEILSSPPQRIRVTGGSRIRSASLVSTQKQRASYDWERDFPISLQVKKPEGKTVLDYEFELTQVEIAEFKQVVKSNLNGLLPVRLSLSNEGFDFEIRKQGPGGPALSRKRNHIASFIASHLSVKEIPSIRTAQSAVGLVDDMVSRELRKLESSPEYRKAVDDISALQTPILEELSTTIQQMLSTFLPEVKAVRVEVEDRYRALRQDSRIVIDDGTATDLKYKGDGVQSLAAISLIHHLSQTADSSSELVLAIEEPEAHLHPRAIHQLRGVLQEIALRQQVVLTTHSPLLVNRGDIGSNVIVDRNRAKPARTIQQIRDSLGVRISDNLVAARLVVVVEGESDRTALSALFKYASSHLRSAINEGVMVLEPLRGSTNLVYRMSTLRDQLCDAYAFLDHDAAGLASVAKAEAEGVITSADRSFATSPGMTESEIEDFYNFDLYGTHLKNVYNVDIAANRTFRQRRRKWKDRVKTTFASSGQNWDDSVEARVKQAVAELAAQRPESALHDAWREPFDNLVLALETRLNRI